MITSYTLRVTYRRREVIHDKLLELQKGIERSFMITSKEFIQEEEERGCCPIVHNILL